MCCRSCALQKSGAIINIYLNGRDHHLSLCRLQGDQSGRWWSFTEQLAYQNAQYGIRANVILPGLINTPMAVDTRARKLFKKTRAEVGGQA